MPEWSQITDTTTANLPSVGPRGRQVYRPFKTSGNYQPGTVLQLVSVDNQFYPDWITVQPMPSGTTLGKFAGVVPDDWPGFAGSVNAVPYAAASYVSTTQSTPGLVRGTQFVGAVVKGYARVLIDQSGAGATTLTDGLALVSSRNTAGYAQGLTAASAFGGLSTVGVANLPAAGIGSSITAASLAQATQTFTVTTPANGDTLNMVLQIPYTDLAPGAVQTATYSLTLNATTAGSVTLAAAAMVAYLNAQPSFSAWWVATNVAGVITVTVLAGAPDWLVTYGSGTVETSRAVFSLSGMLANSLTTSSSVTGAGGTGFAAGGANFTGGTGYFGRVPAFILGEF